MVEKILVSNDLLRKQISLRVNRKLVGEFDSLREFTRLSNRNDMIEHAMRLYVTYIYHCILEEVESE